MSWPRPELGGAGDGKGKADWGRFYTHVHVNGSIHTAPVPTQAQTYMSTYKTDRPAWSSEAFIVTVSRV